LQAAARPQATLVDLLDRVLDRGVLINADIVISLAGVPLIAVNLRAALAGVETMLRYGVLKEDDTFLLGIERRAEAAPEARLAGFRPAT